MPVTSADIILRTSNTAPNKFQANSFIALADVSEIIKFRVDADLWEAIDEDLQVRFLVSAYMDIMKGICWTNALGRSQSRDYEFQMTFSPSSEPPIGDVQFDYRISQAQAAQTMYLVCGSQVRDMAAEGIRMSRALSGSEIEFSGYRGPVCTEASELLGPWIERSPQLRRY